MLILKQQQCWTAWCEGEHCILSDQLIKFPEQQFHTSGAHTNTADMNANLLSFSRNRWVTRRSRG